MGAMLIVLCVLSASIETRAAELVMFEHRGCLWCARWHAEVGGAYSRTSEGKRAPLRRLDLARAAGAGVQFAAPVAVSPTFVLVDQGREIGRIVGYPGADFFWGLVSELVERLPSESR